MEIEYLKRIITEGPVYCKWFSEENQVFKYTTFISVGQATIETYFIEKLENEERCSYSTQTVNDKRRSMPYSDKEEEKTFGVALLKLITE